jgi:hypothetical protein
MRWWLLIIGLLAHLPPLSFLTLALGGIDLINPAAIPRGMSNAVCQEWVRSLLFYALAYSYTKLLFGWYQHGEGSCTVVAFLVYSGSRARRSCAGWLGDGQGAGVGSVLVQLRQRGWAVPQLSEQQLAAFTKGVSTGAGPAASLHGEGRGSKGA